VLSVLAGICWTVYSLALGLLAGAWLKDQPMLSALVGITLAVGLGLVVDRVLAVRRRSAREVA
jgi:membrane protein DedA with SNARE-associated domain